MDGVRSRDLSRARNSFTRGRVLSREKPLRGMRAFCEGSSASPPTARVASIVSVLADGMSAAVPDGAGAEPHAIDAKAPMATQAHGLGVLRPAGPRTRAIRRIRVAGYTIGTEGPKT
jgi:hypothetical protein